MTIPASDRVRRFRERGCGSACQGDSPRYALLSLMYAARVYANLHRREVGYQSSLKEGIRANNAEQQWVFHGLNCVQYQRYSLSSVSLVFTAQCFRMLQQRISFLLAATAMSLFTNLLEITFVFSLPFCSFPSFSPRFLSLCARALSRYFPLSRYKICSNANSERNTKDKISALETGEFNLPLRSPRGRRRKNNRLCGASSFV